MNTLRFLLAIATAIAALAFPAGIVSADGHITADIVETAVADGRFTTLVTAVTEAGLVETLQGDGPFTVFAPTDDAFAKLPDGTVQALLGDIPALTDILLYHVVPGKVMAADVVNVDMAATAQGENVYVTANDHGVRINESNVIITDIETTNGVIHVIDTVLLPPAALAEGDYRVKSGDTLYQIAMSELGDGSRYMEIVEATNKAYEADRTYAFVENPDLIYVASKLVIPQTAPAAALPNIVEIAVADGRFTTLVAAVTEAGLVETLTGEGPFTVFAPTDDAFDKLPEGTVEGLLADIPALTDILLYHVVPGKVMAADVASLTSADTAQGSALTIKVDDGVMVDEAYVVITDIEASNGVIHVIDSVLIP